MNLRSHLLFTLVACGLVGSFGCATGPNRCGTSGNGHRFSPGKGEHRLGWTETAMPVVAGKDWYRAHVIVGPKTWDFQVEYGPDPMVGNGSVEPVVTNGGSSWRQSGGFFYLWERWLLFETDRVRTITWGTEVVGRFLESGYLGNSLAREQIFVLSGKVVLLPKDGGSSVLINKGEYVVVSGDAASGITVTGPTTIPEGDCKQGSQSTEDDIICFLERVSDIHATIIPAE